MKIYHIVQNSASRWYRKYSPLTPMHSHAYFRQLPSALTTQRQEFTSQLPTQNLRTLETDLYKMLQCFTCQRQSIYFKLKIIHTSETTFSHTSLWHALQCAVVYRLSTKVLEKGCAYVPRYTVSRPRRDQPSTPQWEPRNLVYSCLPSHQSWRLGLPHAKCSDSEEATYRRCFFTSEVI